MITRTSRGILGDPVLGVAGAIIATALFAVTPVLIRNIMMNRCK